MSKFLKGTLILLFAGLITRILGFINRILIARFIGEEGVGLYMMAYPTFILVVTLTQMGLPVAISKRVAEAEALGDSRKIKKILVVSLVTTLTLSIIFTPLLLFGAPILAKTIFTDERIVYPIIAIAPVIPIIAVSSIIRGYFQGKQNMKPSAYSQLIEQFISNHLYRYLNKNHRCYSNNWIDNSFIRKDRLLRMGAPNNNNGVKIMDKVKVVTSDTTKIFFIFLKSPNCFGFSHPLRNGYR